MHKLETHFIPENIAPWGTEGIVVLDGKNNQVGSIPINGLAHPTQDPDGVVLVLADIHIDKETAPEDFDSALTYADDHCAFTIIAGDLTYQGIKSDYTPYKSIVSAHKKPVYAIAGNHENYSNRDPAWLKDATGGELYYSFEYGNDVFVMVGHYGGYDNSITNWRTDNFISEEELNWLYETLEENRNRRCFVINHAFPAEHNVGNPNNFYTDVLPWRTTDGYIGQAYISLLRHYKNTFLFTGHSHARLELQAVESTANYSNKDGYNHIHVPSLSVPRDIKDGTIVNVPDASQGSVLRLYPSFFTIEGRDFVGNKPIPLGIYKINTPLYTVEKGTFVDETGLIQT